MLGISRIVKDIFIILDRRRTVLEIFRIVKGVFDILDRRTIIRIHMGRIVLFSKGCPKPSCLYTVDAAAAAPAQATAALTRRQSLCHGAATPAADTSTGAAPADATPAGDRPCGCVMLQPATLGRLPLRSGRGRASPPCGLALAAAGRLLQVARPWSAAPARGLVVASHLCMQTTCRWPPLPRRQRYFRCQSLGRSYIPVF
ncbi:hypothetical protein GW17_00016473 [Ensete ventricosum]|nr:hypothetical protein GW17_00016473 [Ensete ventricosum]